jgi:uncharacterized protein YndB with AHSA1/START domain
MTDLNNPAPATDTQTVTIERTFPHSPQKLWRALTENKLIAQWLMTNDFEPVLERKFQLRADPVPQWDGIIDCQVLIVDPLKRLSYTWSTMGLGSVVLFTLTPTDAGTHLRMDHSGFRHDQQAAYKGATYGWQNFLGRLERLLNGPEGLNGESA